MAATTMAAPTAMSPGTVTATSGMIPSGSPSANLTTAQQQLAAIQQAMLNLDAINKQVEATKTLLHHCIQNASFGSLPPLRAMSPPPLGADDSALMLMRSLSISDPNNLTDSNTTSQPPGPTVTTTTTVNSMIPNNNNNEPLQQPMTEAVQRLSPNINTMKIQDDQFRGRSGSRDNTTVSKFTANNEDSNGDLSQSIDTAHSPMPIKAIQVTKNTNGGSTGGGDDHSVTSILLQQSANSLSGGSDVDDEILAVDLSATDRNADDELTTTNRSMDDTSNVSPMYPHKQSKKSKRFQAPRRFSNLSSPDPRSRAFSSDSRSVESIGHQSLSAMNVMVDESERSSMTTPPKRSFLKSASGPAISSHSRGKSPNNYSSNEAKANAIFGQKQTSQEKRRGKTKRSRSIRRFFGAKDKAMEDLSGKSSSNNSRSIRRNFSANEGGSNRAKPQRGRLSRWNSSRSLNRSSSGKDDRLTARTPDTLAHLNIFCSDMVSADFILSELQQLKDDPSIVHLELEDCLVTMTLPIIGPSLRDIPRLLKEILLRRDRKWKGIRIVDDLVNGWSYPDYLTSRQQFLQILEECCNQERIPLSFKSKIHLTDTDDPGASPAYLVPLLEQFQSDSDMIRLDLTLNTTPTTLELLQTLTKLLSCDERDWEDVKLQLLTTGNEPNSQWTPDMHEALAQLEQAAKAACLTGLC